MQTDPMPANGGWIPEKRTQDNLTSSDVAGVLGAPWVPTRAAERVYPAMADGYRPFWGVTVHPRFCWIELVKHEREGRAVARRDGHDEPGADAP